MRKLFKWFSRKIFNFSGDKKYCLKSRIDRKVMPFSNSELLFLHNAITSVKSKALTDINFLAADYNSDGILSNFYQEIVKDSDKVLKMILSEIRHRGINKTYLQTIILAIEDNSGEVCIAELFKTNDYGRCKN